MARSWCPLWVFSSFPIHMRYKNLHLNIAKPKAWLFQALSSNSNIEHTFAGSLGPSWRYTCGASGRWGSGSWRCTTTDTSSPRVGCGGDGVSCGGGLGGGQSGSGGGGRCGLTLGDGRGGGLVGGNSGGGRCSGRCLGSSTWSLMLGTYVDPSVTWSTKVKAKNTDF